MLELLKRHWLLLTLVFLWGNVIYSSRRFLNWNSSFLVILNIVRYFRILSLVRNESPWQWSIVNSASQAVLIIKINKLQITTGDVLREIIKILLRDVISSQIPIDRRNTNRAAFRINAQRRATFNRLTMLTVGASDSVWNNPSNETNRTSRSCVLTVSNTIYTRRRWQLGFLSRS